MEANLEALTEIERTLIQGEMESRERSVCPPRSSDLTLVLSMLPSLSARLDPPTSRSSHPCYPPCLSASILRPHARPIHAALLVCPPRSSDLTLVPSMLPSLSAGLDPPTSRSSHPCCPPPLPRPIHAAHLARSPRGHSIETIYGNHTRQALVEMADDPLEAVEPTDITGALRDAHLRGLVGGSTADRAAARAFAELVTRVHGYDADTTEPPEEEAQVRDLPISPHRPPLPWPSPTFAAHLRSHLHGLLPPSLTPLCIPFGVVRV